MLPLGDAVTINQMKPPVTALMASLLLHEPLGWLGLAGCLVSMSGVVVLAHPPFLFGGHQQWDQTRALGTIFGLICPVFAAGVSYAIRRIAKSEPALVVALWFHTSTLVLFTLPLLLGFPNHAVVPIPRDAGLLVGVAATSFTAQILMTRGLQLTPAAKAAAMGFTQVVYGHTLGLLLLGERFTAMRCIGTTLILLGVLLVVLQDAPKTTSSAAAAEATTGEVIAPTSYKLTLTKSDSMKSASAAGLDGINKSSAAHATDLIPAGQHTNPNEESINLLQNNGYQE